MKMVKLSLYLSFLSILYVTDLFGQYESNSIYSDSLPCTQKADVFHRENFISDASFSVASVELSVEKNKYVDLYFDFKYGPKFPDVALNIGWTTCNFTIIGKYFGHFPELRDTLFTIANTGINCFDENSDNYYNPPLIQREGQQRLSFTSKRDGCLTIEFYVKTYIKGNVKYIYVPTEWINLTITASAH